MNIRDFKIGDIITRNEPVIYPNGHADSSYCGTRIELVDVDEEAKIIFFKRIGNGDHKNIIHVSFARDSWDQGWARYPVTPETYTVEIEICCSCGVKSLSRLTNHPGRPTVGETLPAWCITCQKHLDAPVRSVIPSKITANT